ncbi:G protein-coupled receptor [Balamuthia mandrillaris]
MTINDDQFGRAPPSCPEAWHWMGYPSVVFVYILMAMTSLVFCLIAAIKYNSVKVFNRSIRTENISNTMWILFYVFIALRAASNAVRYALDRHSDEYLDTYFVYSSIVLYGVTALSLCFALNHQRKHRSTAPAPPQRTPVNEEGRETDPLLTRYGRIRKTVGWSELIFILLFLLYIAFLILFIVKNGGSDKDHRLWLILFIVAFALQRAPIVILVLIIVLQHSSLFQKAGTQDGPTLKSKIYLVVAAVLNLANDLPLPVWAKILPDNCIFWIGSYVDLIHIIYFISLLFFFLFIRSEYLRNMEECIWTTVSQIQDTFNFRRF